MLVANYEEGRGQGAGRLTGDEEEDNEEGRDGRRRAAFKHISAEADGDLCCSFGSLLIPYPRHALTSSCFIEGPLIIIWKLEVPTGMPPFRVFDCPHSVHSWLGRATAVSCG